MIRRLVNKSIFQIAQQQQAQKTCFRSFAPVFHTNNNNFNTQSIINTNAIRFFSMNHQYLQQQQQQQQKEVYEAEYIDTEVVEEKSTTTTAATEDEQVDEQVVDNYDTEGQLKKRRITARQQPKHTTKEMASYPSATFYQKDLKQGYRKVNQVARLIRGLNAREAMFQLEFSDRKIGPPLAKFLKSCIVNCENFHGMNADRLLVKEASVGRARYLRRLRYHAKMRHGIMRRKHTHFYIKLVEVPLKENERRLGRHGWHNSTWEKVYAKYQNLSGGANSTTDSTESQQQAQQQQ
jgi:large subunit ribosomal protein L22